MCTRGSDPRELESPEPPAAARERLRLSATARVTLTVGIAQVRSRTPLTGGESVIKMGRILWESMNQKFADLSDELSRIEAAPAAYDGSPRYGAAVLDICRRL